MKTQRWLALVSSLLIIGLFIAPGHSEAVGPPFLTVDNVPVVFQPTTGTGTTTPGTCSTSDRTAGYTACFQIPPGTYNRLLVNHVSSTNLARLLVADTTGSGTSLDLFTLTGVKFQPSPAFTSFQDVSVIYTNTFDAAPNPAGTYLFAMRVGGYFVAGNTNGDNTDIGDEVNLSGFGDFGSGPVFLGSLDTGSFGGPASSVVSFSLSQTQPYQANNCNTNTVLNQCSPTIMQTLMFVEFNGDTLFLTNSSDGAGGDCVVTPPAVPPSPPFGLPPGPVSPCKAREGKIKSFFNGADSADNRAANQAGASPSTPCETEVCFPPGGGG